MRPDEGGCADLRRSLTARTKLVRSPTYAPARRARPRAGGVGPPDAQGAFRSLCHRRGATRSGASTDARLPGVPSACGTAPPPAGFRHREAVAEPGDLGRNRILRLVATRCHRRAPRSGHPTKGSPACYRGYRAARPTLRGSEISPLWRAPGKPAPATTGRHGEPGVSWHTGGVRAHCTGATESGTAATLGDWGAFL